MIGPELLIITSSVDLKGKLSLICENHHWERGRMHALSRHDTRKSESLFLLLSMKQVFKAGAKKRFSRMVTEADTARFESGQVHAVYSTFALARDAEWTCRLFVLEMKEEEEEGIGTFITVDHHAPALLNEHVSFEAELESINGNEIICEYKAMAGDRLVASGKQGQKILKKVKIKEIFEKVKNG